jgi:hypothetical protein
MTEAPRPEPSASPPATARPIRSARSYEALLTETARSLLRAAAERDERDEHPEVDAA